MDDDEFVRRCKEIGVKPSTIRRRMRKLECDFNQAVNGIQKTCARCGRPFVSYKKESKFCSQNCYSADYYEREKRRVDDPCREPTATTLFLLPMYHDEGMTAEEIAVMTRRDLGIVKKILAGEWVLKDARTENKNDGTGNVGAGINDTDH